jgi:hypothetical protein
MRSLILPLLIGVLCAAEPPVAKPIVSPTTATPTNGEFPAKDLRRILEEFEAPSNWAECLAGNRAKSCGVDDLHRQVMALGDAVAANDWKEIQAALAFIPEGERMEVLLHMEAHQASQQGDSSRLVSLKSKYAASHWDSWQHLEKLSRDIADGTRPITEEELQLAEKCCQRAVELIRLGDEESFLPLPLLETLARLSWLQGDKEGARRHQQEAIAALQRSIEQHQLDAAELLQHLKSYEQGVLPEPRSR